MEIGYVSSLITVLVWSHVALGAVFLVCALFEKLRGRGRSNSGRRGRCIWLSLGMFALAAVCDVWFLRTQADGSASSSRFAFATLFLLCASLAFAGVGKGPGRSVLAVASALLAMLWLPLILP
jgi:hypothetical protein